MPRHHGLNPPLPLTHQLYSLLPAGSESLDYIPIDYRDLGSSQPPETYNPWGTIQPPSNLLPNAAYGVPPPYLHHSTLDLTLYSNLLCQQPWSAADSQVSFQAVDERMPTPSHHHPPAALLHTYSTFHPPHVDYASESASGTFGTSYPCQWTEGGVICNVMVQATRSHMNRHLHAHHGFKGSDTQQMKCQWAECGEIMQQGSIARHMVTCHLQAKVTCPMCSKKLSRQDVISKHQRVCPAASTRC